MTRRPPTPVTTCRPPRRRPWAWLLVLALLPLPAGAARVRVEVTGVEGEWQRNVLALLGIYQEQSEDLSEERLQALHRRAPEQIANALAPFGLYQVKVTDSLTAPANPGATGATWLARYQIEPGPPTKVVEVTYLITGDGADNPRFPAEFPLRVGDVLIHSIYEAGRNEVTSVASQQGYLDAQLLRHIVLVDPEANQAFVDVQLDTGPRYYLGPVTFQQDLLAEPFLQRFVPFAPGTVYDPGLLLALQGRLLGTEYFKRVEVTPLKDQADANRQVPILVQAERNKANKYRVGLGFATDVGPRLSLDYRRRYIGRNGHKARVDLEVSQIAQALVGEYRVPIRDPLQDYLMLRTTLSNQDTITRKGTVFRVSAAQSVVTPGGWRREMGLDYRYEDLTVTDTETEPFNGLVPNISWSRIRADNTLNTRNGYRIKYALQGTVEGVLAESTWVSGTLSFKWIKSLGETTRFITRSDLGLTWANALNEVPASQRFFAGGDQSLRGFALDALGPINPDTGEVVGGRMLATGSLELEQRIRGKWSGVVFTDFGNAFDPDYTDKWEQSAGLGLRYATPIGPVRLDLAYAITKDEPGVRLHVGLGPDL